MQLFSSIQKKSKLERGCILFVWLLLIAGIKPAFALKIEETREWSFMGNEYINFQTHLNPIEKKTMLCKVTQGQVSAYMSPDKLLYKNIHGLKEAIYQDWIKNDSIWVNYLKKSYTVDNQDNLTKVTTWQFDDTTGTFKHYLETEMEYHSKGKVSKATEKWCYNGKWTMSSMLTIEYNAIDSPCTYRHVLWDSSQSTWGANRARTWNYTYGSNGKLSKIDYEVVIDGVSERSTTWFTYLPDGKIDREEMSVPSGIAKKTHQYPDPYTEIVTSIDDSTTIYYNRAGLIDSTVKYYLPLYPKNGIERDHSMYDNQSRPLFRFLSYRDDDSGTVSGWLIDKRITYYYSDNYVKGNSYQEKNAGNLNWHKISERTFLFEGLPESSTAISIEIFNLAGVTLQKYNGISTAERRVQIRVADLLPEGYYTFRIKQGNTSCYIGLQLH
jgi:hypothetical protein